MNSHSTVPFAHFTMVTHVCLITRDVLVVLMCCVVGRHEVIEYPCMTLSLSVLDACTILLFSRNEAHLHKTDDTKHHLV